MAFGMWLLSVERQQKSMIENTILCNMASVHVCRHVVCVLEEVADPGLPREVNPETPCATLTILLSLIFGQRI
jgi:hypothetical protein